MSVDRPIERARKAAAFLESSALTLDAFEDAFAEATRILGGRSFHAVRVRDDGAQDFLSATETRNILANYFDQKWYEVDTWSQLAQQATRRGQIVSDLTLVPPDVRRRDQFFQEFCRDWDLGHYAAWTFQLEGETWGFTLIREHGCAYDADDLAALDVLRPAANKAAHLAYTFRNARVRGLAEGLERSMRPSLALDRRGRLVFCTRGAEALMGRAFTVKQGVLQGMDARSEEALRQVRGWLQMSRPRLPESFSLTGPLLTRPVIVMPMALRNDFFATLPGAHVLLMLIDPEDRRAPTVQALISGLGLTVREAEVGRRLVMGRTPQETAQDLGIQESTARTMIKSIMAKTGCHRQSDLVLLLSKFT